MNAYQRLGQLKFSAKEPKDDILGTVRDYRNDQAVDGQLVEGLVLKNGNVVIKTSGGMHGITMYSQPIDLVRVPR